MHGADAPAEVELTREQLAELIPVDLHDLLDDDLCVPDEEAALLPYQRRWVYDRRQLKVAAKSRRVGITWATAFEAVEVAALRRDEGGMNVWYMANTLDDAREFIGDVADWVEWLKPIYDGFAAASIESERFGATEQFVDDADRDILVFSVRFASGHKVHALTSKPRRLRGKSGYAILDEAAYHDNLDAWLKAARAFTMWGGRVAVISTYSGADNAFAELVERVEQGRAPGVVHKIDIYQALREGFYGRVCRVQGIPWTQAGEDLWLHELKLFYGDDFDEECGCVPKRSGGAYLPRDMVLDRMVLDEHHAAVVTLAACEGSTEEERNAAMQRWLDAEVYPRLRRLALPGYYAGVDFGRRANLTVLTLLGLRDDLTRQAELIVELGDIPFAQQDLALDYVFNRLGGRLRKVCLDSSGLGMPSAERVQSRLGAGVAELVTLSEGWYATHWPPLRRLFEQGTVALPRYQPLLDDLAQVRRVGGKVVIVEASARKGEGGKASKRHADGAVSLLLAEAAVGTQAGRPPQTLGERYGRRR